MAKGLIKSLRKKDVKTISKLISNIENKDEGYLDSLSDINSYIGNAYRIGITYEYKNEESFIKFQKILKEFMDKPETRELLAGAKISSSRGVVLFENNF